MKPPLGLKIDKFGWNTRMMVWVGLIIIIAWSFNRLVGRNDCLDTSLVSEFHAVGPMETTQISLCERASQYDFSVDRYSELLSKSNDQLKGFTLSAEPVKLQMSEIQPFAYDVSPGQITLGSELFSEYLPRALIEHRFKEQLPEGESRELYLDLLVEAYGVRVKLPQSIYLVHNLVDLDRCSRFGVPADAEACQVRGRSPEKLSPLMAQRTSVISLWRVFYASLDQTTLEAMYSGLNTGESFEALPPLDLSSVAGLKNSYLASLKKMAASLFPVSKGANEKIQERFVAFLRSAIGIQVRGSSLIVDFLLPRERIDLRFHQEHKSSVLLYPTVNDKGRTFSPVHGKPIQRGNMDLKLLYFYDCVSAASEEFFLNRQDIGGEEIRRYFAALDCPEKMGFAYSSHGEFLEAHPNLSFFLLYLPGTEWPRKLRFGFEEQGPSSFLGSVLETSRDPKNSFSLVSESALESFRAPAKRSAIKISN